MADCNIMYKAMSIVRQYIYRSLIVYYKVHVIHYRKSGIVYIFFSCPISSEKLYACKTSVGNARVIPCMEN